MRQSQPASPSPAPSSASGAAAESEEGGSVREERTWSLGPAPAALHPPRRRVTVSLGRAVPASHWQPLPLAVSPGLTAPEPPASSSVAHRKLSPTCQ
eukprot:2506433-Rhodomonas_salina.1